jgi:hypothetical protein
MARFIKYTEKIQMGQGERRSLVLVNTDFIAKATYTEEGPVLRLVIACPSSAQRPVDAVEIKGQDAEDAMKVLSGLSNSEQ